MTEEERQKIVGDKLKEAWKYKPAKQPEPSPLYTYLTGDEEYRPVMEYNEYLKDGAKRGVIDDDDEFLYKGSTKQGVVPMIERSLGWIE